MSSHLYFVVAMHNNGTFWDYLLGMDHPDCFSVDWHEAIYGGDRIHPTKSGAESHADRLNQESITREWPDGLPAPRYVVVSASPSEVNHIEKWSDFSQIDLHVSLYPDRDFHPELWPDENFGPQEAALDANLI